MTCRVPAAGVIVFLLAAAVAGCRGVRAPEEPTGPHVSVLTWNVNWGALAPGRAAALIRAANADIVCLQETTPEWERVLRPGMAEVYPFIEFRHSPGAGGMSVLSRRAFRTVHYGRPAAGWFPAWVFVAETDIGELLIANVHLRPPLSDQGRVTASGYFGIGTIHRDEITEIAGRVDFKGPVLFAGDFNENENGDAVSLLREKGLVDALSDFDRYANTWEWNVGSSSIITLTNRYDHILYSPQLHCLSARVLRGGASDHFPVLAVFERMVSSDDGN